MDKLDDDLAVFLRKKKQLQEEGLFQSPPDMQGGDY